MPYESQKEEDAVGQEKALRLSQQLQDSASSLEEDLPRGCLSPKHHLQGQSMKSHEPPSRAARCKR